MPTQLCRFALDRAANPVLGFTVHRQVVLLAAVLLDLRHDFLFAVSTDLPIAGLRTDIAAWCHGRRFFASFRGWSIIPLPTR